MVCVCVCVCVSQVEAYRADKREMHMAAMLDVTADTVAGLPTHYLLNICIPDYSPQWRRPPNGFDGPGVLVLVHARMTPATRQALTDGDTAPGLLSPTAKSRES
jgi:hypothetical protein